MTTEKTPRTIVELNFRDRLSKLQSAAETLGSISIRVVEDPEEALGLLRAQIIAKERTRHPEASEAELLQYASIRWPESRVGEYTGPEAVRAVTEITFYGDHGIVDLQQTATHGGTAGRT